jgi:hypothetical protein
VKDLNGRVERLGRRMRRPDPEEIDRRVSSRILMGITDALEKLRAAGSKRGGPGYAERPERKSVMEETYGPDWTVAQWCEEAIRRFVYNRLEECLSPGFCTHHDFRQYLEEDDLSPEGRERLVQEYLEHFRFLMEEEVGFSWEEPPEHP